MALDLNDPEVKAAVEAIVEEQVKGLKTKNAELLRKLEASKEIKPEDYQRALEERDTALGKVEKLTSENRDLKTASKATQDKLAQRAAAHERTLVDDHLTNALVKAGVRPEFMDFVKSFHRGNAKVVEEAGEFKALLGDKPIADAIAEWSASDAGKAVIAAPANGGGGATGSKGGSGGPKQIPKAEFDALDSATRQSMLREGKVEIVG